MTPLLLVVPRLCRTATPLLSLKTKITEGVRAAVLACVEKSTNSEGRIVEVNAFADFFAKAIGESRTGVATTITCCVNLGVHGLRFFVHLSSVVSLFQPVWLSACRNFHWLVVGRLCVRCIYVPTALLSLDLTVAVRRANSRCFGRRRKPDEGRAGAERVQGLQGRRPRAGLHVPRVLPQAG